MEYITYVGTILVSLIVAASATWCQDEYYRLIYPGESYHVGPYECLCRSPMEPICWRVQNYFHPTYYGRPTPYQPVEPIYPINPRYPQRPVYPVDPPTPTRPIDNVPSKPVIPIDPIKPTTKPPTIPDFNINPIDTRTQ